MEQTADHIKMTFQLGANEWHGYLTETLWVLPSGEDDYRIDNSPFLAKGVSYRDIVIGEQTTKGLEFKAVKFGAGHSTYRVILKNGRDISAFLNVWQPFADAGCTYEHGDFLKLPLIAIDIPPQADIAALYTILEHNVENGLWDFEEANFQRLKN